jgi:hypothetical protein
MAALSEIVDLTRITSDTDSGIVSSLISVTSHKQSPNPSPPVASNGLLRDKETGRQHSYYSKHDILSPSSASSAPNDSSAPQIHSHAHSKLNPSNSRTSSAFGPRPKSANETESEDARFQNHILTTVDSSQRPDGALPNCDTNEPRRLANDPTPSLEPTCSAIPDSTETSPMPQRHTPKRMAWTTEKIAQQLSIFAKQLGNDHRMMYYRTIQDHKHDCPPDWRCRSGKDRFEGVKIQPTAEEKGVTVRTKFKVSRAPTYCITIRFTCFECVSSDFIPWFRTQRLKS